MQEAQRLAEITPKIMNAFHDLGRQHPDTARLSMRQYQALIILNANQRLTPSQLCDKLSLAPSTGTELMNRMSELGFIQKAQQRVDQRQVILSVTPKGEVFLKERQQTLTKMFAKFMELFEPEDQQTFVRCFEQIWELIAKYRQK